MFGFNLEADEQFKLYIVVHDKINSVNIKLMFYFALDIHTSYTLGTILLEKYQALIPLSRIIYIECNLLIISVYTGQLLYPM